MSQDLAAKLDDLFERIVFTKPVRLGPGNGRRHAVEPLSFDELDVLLCLGLGREEERGFLLDHETCGRGRVYFEVDALWPFKVQVVSQASGRGWPTGSLLLSSVESCDRRSARNWGATMFGHRMVLERLAVIQRCGAVTSACTVLAHVGGRWIDARRRPAWDRVSGGPTHEDGYVPHLDYRHDDRDEEGNFVAMAQSIALTQRYEWSVCIGLGNGPKLRLASDPTGLRAMFRDREKEEGRDRRAALRHWVQAHWRQKRRDPYDLAWVRAYLRGRTAFRWYGYDCVIRPSAYDLELLARSA